MQNGNGGQNRTGSSNQREAKQWTIDEENDRLEFERIFWKHIYPHFQKYPFFQLSPVQKAGLFLENSCSVTSGYQVSASPTRRMENPRPVQFELFSCAILYDVIKSLEPDLVNPLVCSTLLRLIEEKRTPSGLFSFHYPPQCCYDVDTTSVASLVLFKAQKMNRMELAAVAKEISRNVNADTGLVETFFPPDILPGSFPDILGFQQSWYGDPSSGVHANVIRLLLAAGLNPFDQIPETMEWIIRTFSDSQLFTQQVENGLCYNVEVTLFLFSQVLEAFEGKEMDKILISKSKEFTFADILIKRLASRFNQSTFPLDIAMRILTAVNLGLVDFYPEADDQCPTWNSDLHLKQDPCQRAQRKNYKDAIIQEVETLKAMQNNDGSWPPDALYNYKVVFYGAKFMSTVFCARALQLTQSICQHQVNAN